MAYGTVNADIIGTSVTGSNLGAGNASMMKNRIINGAMVIDQRNAGASITPTTDAFTVDRFKLQISQASKFSAQQNAGAVTPPVSFTNYLGVTTASAYSVLTGDYFRIYQGIEGFNIADLGWGTANAKTVTLSFWVRSSLTGTFGGTLQNGGNTLAYPYTYTISSANTWTQISVTIAGPTTGTWTSTNTAGVTVGFGLGVGATYSAAAGSWQSGNYLGATGATSVVGTLGATFYITGVQLEVGSSATGFEYRQYGQELALCQRYYWRSTAGTFNALGSGVAFSTSSAHIYIKHPVAMRASPTFSYTGAIRVDGSTGGDVTSISATYSGLDSSRVDFSTVASLTANQGALLYVNTGANDLLQSTAEL